MKIKGFTLIELLLGMAITAIIGVCVYNIFWSAMKLDDKMRHVQDNYMELLMADQALSRDLENAISLDLSASYPDAVIFDGEQKELSFITQTPQGLRRVRYYTSDSQGNKTAESMIGRVVNPANENETQEPAEFLWRQESNLADWLNETTDNTSKQIVATGLKKESFTCQYAASVKNLHVTGEQGIDYQDSWDDKGLPMAVSCSFILFDPKNTHQDLMFKRDIFLAPLVNLTS